MKKLDLLGMIPGVKEKREADVLREFADDSSNGEAEKIQDLTRRSFLKMGGTFLAALGTGAAVYGVDKQMDINDKKFERKAKNEVTKLIYESGSPINPVNSQQYLDGDGNVQPISESTGGIRGFLQHLNLTSGSIRVDGEEVKYEILKDRLRINLFSGKELVGKPIVGINSIMISDDYLSKHAIDRTVREFPCKVTARGREFIFTHNIEYTITRLPREEEEQMRKLIGDKIVINQHEGKIEELPEEALMKILNFYDTGAPSLLVVATLPISDKLPLMGGISKNMSDEALILSAPNMVDGELNGKKFKVKDVYSITFYGTNGQKIEEGSLVGGIMISKKQLRDMGALTIKLYINLDVGLGDGRNATVFGQQVIDLRSAKFVKIDAPFKIERPNGTIVIEP